MARLLKQSYNAIVVAETTQEAALNLVMMDSLSTLVRPRLRTAQVSGAVEILEAETTIKYTLQLKAADATRCVMSYLKQSRWTSAHLDLAVVVLQDQSQD